jgi:hypothetical protein
MHFWHAKKRKQFSTLDHLACGYKGFKDFLQHILQTYINPCKLHALKLANRQLLSNHDWRD